MKIRSGRWLLPLPMPARPGMQNVLLRCGQRMGFGCYPHHLPWKVEAVIVIRNFSQNLQKASVSSVRCFTQVLSRSWEIRLLGTGSCLRGLLVMTDLSIRASRRTKIDLSAKRESGFLGSDPAGSSTSIILATIISTGW